MADAYQAIYDATRSRISPVDSSAVENAAREAFGYFSNLIPHAQQEIYVVSDHMTRPHVLMRPTVRPDGNAWCALYGDNLQEGVSGFGDTPAEACAAFDKNWLTMKLPARAQAGQPA